MTVAEGERSALMSNGNADDYTHFGDSGYALMAAVAARAIPRIRKV